jgi:hypothetical protein
MTSLGAQSLAVSQFLRLVSDNGLRKVPPPP